MSALIFLVRRVLVSAVLVLLLDGCSWQPHRGESFSEITQKIRQGNLPEAERALSSIRVSSGSGDERAWRVRLVDAELAIAKGRFDNAGDLLRKLMPPLPGHPELEARRLLELVYVSTYTRKYPAAREVLSKALATAPASDQQLNLELQVARGVLATYTEP